MKTKQVLSLIVILSTWNANAELFWSNEPLAKLAFEPWTAESEAGFMNLNNDGAHTMVLNVDGSSSAMDFVIDRNYSISPVLLPSNSKNVSDADCSAVAPVKQLFTAIQVTHTIEFTLDPTTYLNYDNLELPIYSSLGLPISYTIDNGIGSLITVGDTTWYVWDGEGNLTITANQEGNSEVTAAMPVTRTTSVSKKDQTVIWQKTFYDPEGSASLIYNYLEGQNIQMHSDTLRLAATSNSALPVDFTLINGPGYLNGIAEDSANYLYNGIGAVTITAGSSGDIVYNTALPVDVNFTVIKGNQTITFDDIYDNMVVHDTTVVLGAVNSSGRDVTYQVSGYSLNQYLTSNELEITYSTSAQFVTVTAYNLGDENYDESDFGVYPTITFCLMPQKPHIGVWGGLGEVQLVSSNQNDNNQWYKDGLEFSSGTWAITTSELGLYTVVSSSWEGSSECPDSEVSDVVPIIITDLQLKGGQEVEVYPNPVTTTTKVQLPEPYDPADVRVLLIDIVGNTTEMKPIKNGINSQFVIDMTGFNRGVYVLYIKNLNRVYYQKITKI